ncbi:MAG: InlB B-repeat-containing protein, partial [Lachnospiraceae bacterium]|nr:InlB B-repeat-containing protein [Lachnospiraceae bacterium]
YTYTVDPDWSVAADTAITGTTTVTLSQRRTVNNYDITFVFVPVEGDTITRTVAYPYGSTPQWHADVIGAEKADTAQYDYSYAEDAFAEVTGPATYTITESRALQHYTVTFTDHEYDNGEGKDKGRTYTFEGDYGDEITMPAITKKEDDKRYHYTLVMNPETGWNPGETYQITGPASFEASYTGVYIDYKITFKVKAAFDNYEAELGSTVVNLDENVVNTAEVLTDDSYKARYTSDGEYTYTLTDFADSYTVTNVNTVVYAEWTKDATWHTITYLVNGEAAAPQQVQFGKAFEASTAAKKDGYHFTGWSWYKAVKAEDGTVTKGEALDEKPATMPAYDLVAEANYAKNEYIVEFKGLNDKALKEPFTITDGATVTFDGIPAEEGYHFLGWDKSFGPIVNLDHEAHYVITAVYGQEKSISMADVTVTYDGQNHSITATSSTIPAKDIVYSISRNDESHAVQSNVAKDAGVYTVTATGTYFYTLTDGVTVKEFKSIKEATLTINRKSVTVTPERVEITYGDAAVALTAGVSGLVDGESKDLITYTLTRENADNTNAGTYKITASGNEIQGNYKVTFGTADYVIKPIDASSVLITAGSANKTYDGKPLVSEDYTYTGTLMEGDVLVATTKGSVTNVGTADNVISSFKVMRGDVDVTRNYTGIGTANGKLEVTKRDITVQVDHAEKVYDGTPLTENGVTLIDETSLAEGETITATTLGTITDAGEVTNEIDTVTIMHGDEDVTANYNITKVNNTLKISKRVVTITAEDATKYQNEPDPTFRGRVDNAVEAAPIEVYYYRWNAADNFPGDKEIFISVHGTYPNYDIRQINGTFTIIAVGGGNPPQDNPPQDNPPQNPPQENPPVQNPPAENPPAENPPAETQNTEPQQNGDTETVITEPEAAKAAGPAGDEMIPEEETPLASLPNEYYALWLLLILILGYAIYWGFRTYDNNKNLKGNE